MHAILDLQQGKQLLRQARENLIATIGPLFPTVNAQAFFQRQRFSDASLGLEQSSSGINNTTGGQNVFNLYYDAINVSYTLDLFGGIRRQIEAAGAQVDFACFQLRGTYLTLTANIVTIAIAEASLLAQIPGNS